MAQGKKVKTQKSNCFYITLELMRDELKHKNVIKDIIMGKIQNSSEEGLGDSPLLIHGYVNDFYGKRIKHAWIESNGYVVEYSGKNKLVECRKIYYRNHQATSVAQFSPQEAMDLLTRGYAIGFWRDSNKVVMVQPAPSLEQVLKFDFVKLFVEDGLDS